MPVRERVSQLGREFEHILVGSYELLAVLNEGLDALGLLQRSAGYIHSQGVPAEISNNTVRSDLLSFTERFASPSEQLIGCLFTQDAEVKSLRQGAVLATARGKERLGNRMWRKPASQPLAIESGGNVIHHPEARQATLLNRAGKRGFDFFGCPALKANAEAGRECSNLIQPLHLSLRGAHAHLGVVIAVSTLPEDPARKGSTEAQGVLLSKLRLPDSPESSYLSNICGTGRRPRN
jgi:hypothetical protein